MSDYIYKLKTYIQNNQDNKYLILDTETTGLDTSSSFIVQISMLLVGNNFETIGYDIYDSIIKVDCKIKNSHIHKITDSISQTQGRSIIDVLNDFMIILDHCTHIIMYNYKFDYNMLITELLRNNFPIDKLNSKILICPMRELKSVVNSKDKNNQIKFPKQSEAYLFFLKQNSNNDHNSKFDVYNLQEILIEVFKNFVLYSHLMN